MGRIRTIKPDFFRHEGLFEVERETGLPLRIAFAGLWTVADREGRFRWRPRQLKLDVLPFDEVDFVRVLHALRTSGFIVSYTSGREEYGLIPSWSKHQVVNNREAASTLPAPPERHAETSPDDDATAAREPRDEHATGTPLVQEPGEGKGKGKEEEEEGRERLAGGSARADSASVGTRLAKDWSLPDDWRAYCVETRPDLDPVSVAENFRDYWHGRAGSGGRKADWTATWRAWVRKENGKPSTSTCAPGGRRSALHADDLIGAMR